MEGRWTIELCSDCAAGRSTRPYVECQHIGPYDAGPVLDVVPCDDAAIERAAEALIKIAARWGLGEWRTEGAREMMTVAFRAAGETP